MSGTMKDALEKSGIVETPEAPAPTRTSTSKPEWREPLPESADDKPYVPFDAPARTKVKDTKR